MGVNISETSGESYATTNNGLDGWTFDVDLTDPSVVVVTGDFDLADLGNTPQGETDGGYVFGDLSTDEFGTLTANEDDGTFSFVIDKEAVYQSGEDQTVSFTVVGAQGGSDDEDFVTLNLLICVARGTRVKTVRGQRPVETLVPGDLVWTRDGGMQPLRWIGSRRLSVADLRDEPSLRPVRIRAGALGRNRPRRDLVVSPQHKILIDDWRAQVFFGVDAVLVPAKALVNGNTILTDPVIAPVEYFHLMFDRHQVIRTEGAETESFRPGEVTLREVDRATRAELFRLFPALERDEEAYGPPARPCLSVRDAMALTRMGESHAA